MYQTDVMGKNNAYMYRFRTNLCTKKRCRNPSRCFDAHSQVLRRRVPKQDKHGRFNYIPEPCPQWKQVKKCSIGDSCPRSHGWLEVIYHPLLYKTKMCKSYHKKGICHEYGVYCAKAHNPMEIRNLVKIYGEEWKTHYDISKQQKERGVVRNCLKTPEAFSALTMKSPSGKNKKIDDHSNQPDGVQKLHSDQNQGRDSTNSSSEATVETSESPSTCFVSPTPSGNCDNICIRMSDLFLDRGVTSYIDLYAETQIASETIPNLKYSRNPVPQLPWSRTWAVPRKAVSPNGSLSSSSDYSKLLSSSFECSEIWDTSYSDVSSKMNGKKKADVSEDDYQD